jgi:hypothetical protein
LVAIKTCLPIGWAYPSLDKLFRQVDTNEE